MTSFGIVASPALAGVAAVFGLFSVGFATVSKRLERKVTKHEKIYTFALAKQNSVSELRGLVSKETVVLRRWGSETRKFGLSTELTM